MYEEEELRKLLQERIQSLQEQVSDLKSQLDNQTIEPSVVIWDNCNE